MKAAVKPECELNGSTILKGFRSKRILLTAVERWFWVLRLVCSNGSKAREMIWRLEQSSINRENKTGRLVSGVICWTTSIRPRVILLIITRSKKSKFYFKDY